MVAVPPRRRPGVVVVTVAAPGESALRPEGGVSWRTARSGRWRPGVGVPDPGGGPGHATATCHPTPHRRRPLNAEGRIPSGAATLVRLVGADGTWTEAPDPGAQLAMGAPATHPGFGPSMRAEPARSVVQDPPGSVGPERRRGGGRDGRRDGRAPVHSPVHAHDAPGPLEGAEGGEEQKEERQHGSARVSEGSDSYRTMAREVPPAPAPGRVAPSGPLPCGCLHDARSGTISAPGAPPPGRPSTPMRPPWPIHPHPPNPVRFDASGCGPHPWPPPCCSWCPLRRASPWRDGVPPPSPSGWRSGG